MRKGLWLPPAAALAVYLLLPGAHEARAAAAVAACMIGWWLGEAVPLVAASLLPLAVLPPAGAAKLSEAAAPYAHPVIFLFMGGFMVAAAVERWGLHRRIALWTVLRIGASQERVVAGFMLVTAAISLGVSNSAAAMMMFSIAGSVTALSPERRFGTCLALGIAYAATIGGLGTVIGTPPNALLAAFVAERYGRTISFLEWLSFGLPMALVLLPAAWLLLVKVLFPLGKGAIPGGRGALEAQYRALGPMRAVERRVLAVLAAVAAAWVLRPLLEPLCPGGLDDASIAVLGALSLFLLPSGTGERLLDWKTAERIPWDVLLLFGGGLSLAAALERNGLTDRLAGLFAGLGAGRALPALAATALAVYLSEFASNTALVAACLPVFAAAAEGAGLPPGLLLLPLTFGASCAFMLPMGTPPNAIAFASGKVSAREMMKAGFWLDLLSVLLITAMTLALARFPIPWYHGRAAQP